MLGPYLASCEVSGEMTTRHKRSQDDSNVTKAIVVPGGGTGLSLGLVSAARNIAPQTGKI